jgi:hypothetical protein
MNLFVYRYEIMKPSPIETVRVNKATGEEIPGTDIHVPFREKIKEDFAMVFQDNQSIERMFHDPDMTAETVRVFYFLVHRMDYENKLIIHQAAVARELRISPVSMSRIMKRLVDKHFIKKEVIGRSTIYTLDCEFTWRGSASNLRYTRSETRREAQGYAVQN